MIATIGKISKASNNIQLDNINKSTKYNKHIPFRLFIFYVFYAYLCLNIFFLKPIDQT